MSDTKHFRGPDKHVTMHECLENRGELTDQEIVHSIRPTQVTAKKERKNVLYLSVSSLRRLVLCFLKVAITAYYYLSQENIYSNLHTSLPKMPCFLQQCIERLKNKHGSIKKKKKITKVIQNLGVFSIYVCWSCKKLKVNKQVSQLK